MASTEDARSPAPARPRRRALAALAIVALAVTAWLLVAPPGASFPSHPQPAADYAEAMSRAEALVAEDPANLHPLCRVRLMTHGRRTGRVVILLHGITNCPQQFEALGRLLHQRGANVLIARIPHHGLANRLTGDLAQLTARELAGFGDRVADIGRGMGDSVTVAGLSLGAVLAAWIAQERPDVDRAVVIAPVFGVPQVWAPLTPGVTRFFLALPNQFVWWDSRLREAVPGPPYVYPRFSTRALGETMKLGAAVARGAARAAPGAASITLVTLEADPAGSNDAARAIERAWRRRAPGRVEAYQFPRRLGIGHDMIDPLQPYQRTAVVYPVLLDLMGVRSR